MSTETAVVVVVVPDFSGRAAGTFELRSLFFLGSLLENGGAAAAFPIHLACIGEPPESIKRLASTLDCSITVHEPMNLAATRFDNKLRGLEVKGRTPRVLLLDADMLVLSDLSALGELGDCIGVSPALRPHLPDHYWHRIYAALGIAEPDHRIASVLGEMLDPARMGLRSDRQNQRLRRMHPYYHGGFVYAPWSCDLRELWARYIQEVAGLYDEGDVEWPNLGRSDMAGLAVAVVQLARQGTPVVCVNNALDASWPEVYAGMLRWGTVALFHASGIFNDTDVPLTREGIRQAISGYCAGTVSHLENGNRFTRVICRDEAAFHDFFTRLEAELQRIFEARVAPVLGL